MGTHMVWKDTKRIQIVAVIIISVFFILWDMAPVNSINYDDYDNKHVTSQQVMKILKSEADLSVLIFDENTNK